MSPTSPHRRTAPMDTATDPGPPASGADAAAPARGMSRRSLLKAGGAGAALGAVTLPLGRLPAALATSAASGQADDEATDAADPSLALDNIQGNIIGGFNKDYQRFVFFRIGARRRARRWLAGLVDDVATAAEVLAFNDLFRRSRARRGTEASAPRARWVNVAFTHAGLDALGVVADDLDRFPDAFRAGMAARASVIGDVDASAPARWVGPSDRGEGLHGVVLLAADSAGDLRALARDHLARMRVAGVEVVFDQEGRTRADEPGHEHFGFKDGISQPGIRGVTARQNPDDDGQGLPGQDLLWPGEFVLGQATQVREPESADEPENESPGPVSTSGPAWTADGSYLVFRRLRQDVPGFRQFVSDAAAAQGLTEDQMGAKFVGRYKSGAPLERTEDQPDDLDTTAADPSIADPSILDETRVNHFEFGDDVDGLVVPRAAHIRKAYPRDDTTPTGTEADTQTHRLLRRGIPYGRSYRAGAPVGSPGAAAADRGLLFLCYQSDIERQFEFVQSRWVNNPDAPGAGDGHDPVISQMSGDRTFALPGGRPDHVALMERFVTTTGGGYFLQPSLDALRRLSGAGRGTGAGDPDSGGGGDADGGADDDADGDGGGGPGRPAGQGGRGGRDAGPGGRDEGPGGRRV